MRTPHGGAGRARRLVGEMFAARASGLGRSRVATMTDVRAGGAPRISRRRAAITVTVGLLPVGALVGAVRAGRAPRLPGRRPAIAVTVARLQVGALVGPLWGWLAPPVKGAVALTHSG